MIMLDNMSLKKMKLVLDWVRGKVPVEVSGKVTLSRARRIALSPIAAKCTGSSTLQHYLT
jgi:nicotinate-nucleotide pyrophosphorylase